MRLADRAVTRHRRLYGPDYFTARCHHDPIEPRIAPVGGRLGLEAPVALVQLLLRWWSPAGEAVQRLTGKDLGHHKGVVPAQGLERHVLAVGSTAVRRSIVRSSAAPLRR